MTADKTEEATPRRYFRMCGSSNNGVSNTVFCIMMVFVVIGIMLLWKIPSFIIYFQN
uniref:Uncharacterized protein n=1 Tax=Lepeophtheirus salmonis TaxID=72036 RepID=A0A0K2VGT4_LEPSM